MLSTTGVAIAFDNDEMPSATQKGVMRLLDAELTKCGFTGIWRVSPIHRSKGGRKRFAANRLSKTRGGEASIKIITMLKGPDDTWESHLIPPSDYALDDVLAALGGTDTKVLPSIPEDDHVPDPVVKASSTSQLEIGTIFCGKVSSVQSYGAFIDLCEGVTGMCHIGEWDNNFVKDMNRVAKIGQTVNVMLTKIKEDGKLELSRRSAMGCPKDAIINVAEEVQKFKENLNDNGELIIRGFVKDGQPNVIDNLLWLLRIIAKAYNDDSVISQARMSPPGVRYVGDTGAVLAKALCIRFNAIGLASTSGPLLIALKNKGWVERITQLGKRKTKGKITTIVATVGYRIADLGWEEIGGHLKYVSGDQISRCLSTGMPVSSGRGKSKPIEEPESMVTEPLNMIVGDELPTDGIDMSLLREYKQKIGRITEIDEELKPHDDIVLLVMEKMELQEWMDSNPDINKHYQEVQIQIKAMRAQLSEFEELMSNGSDK